MEDFYPSTTFQGGFEKYEYKNGPKGQGYYLQADTMNPPIGGGELEVHMVYGDWCGHSKKMLPIFNSLKAGYLGKVHFINVDCDDTKTEGKKKCMDNQIKFLPTIIFRKNDKSNKVKYNGGPDAVILTNFIEQELLK